ncbi:epidermal growth factor receptor substrate 15 isoform X3 [Ricinus communis]|uniref:epidermal growth factor receptor substrate 15 isoform X3 n=1 Tax=Ricinus communis TaxID=3988 RepID=UPI00077269D7|nr:epidermal growth factor receptor substrate 15 isoform X3 [Ricinus communis]|eukprot:XP_015574637.1 epidermal growth factor receptor substrate 15 isoform X3 [Ricinus communis]
MAGQPNMDQFEAYFRRADLDGDGRISGTEAVNFFQGANLPKQVLAQIWMHADQSRTGFLGRPEFFNALKLVTVAQSKRELTPDIVKAALYGPAAAKIPPPKINLLATPVQQVNPMMTPSAPQMGAPPPTPVQSLGFRGPGLPNAGINQQYFPSPQSQTMRPPQAIPPGIASRPTQGITNPEFSRGSSMMGHSQVVPTGTASRPPHSMPVPTASPSIPTSNISTDWLGGKSSLAISGPPSTPNVTLQSQTQFSMPSQPSATDSKASVVSGNGFATGSSFGADVFSATPSTRRQEPSLPLYSSSSAPASATMVPAMSGGLSVKSNSLDSLQSAYAMQPLGGQLQRTQSLPTSGQQVSTSVSSSVASPSISVGVGNSSDNSQPPWPKMKPSDVQKYTKVFMEVDTDRDGRITGEQARNLFLSWRLPREVLKQVWDLSDQDSDSMLSLREFCFALYLMERYREGLRLPASLPSSIMFDETLLSMTGQPKLIHGNAAWGPNPGFGQQPGMGARSMAPATGLRPPVQVAAQPDSVLISNQQKPRAPALEDSFLNQSDTGGQNSMQTDGTASENKVGESEKVILDSKEKIEFYRSKMQDLVLYKSRCDNRLNEITERALADKREAEILGKKYEEKYKQVAEVASKLTIEEATFRDIQERKFELNQAIINIEQGGSADGILQVRADRIQSDLDELLRVLIERCKKHGLEFKSTAMIELPFGWQPGIQEGAAVWDEEWDKFEDEGFANDLTIDVKNVSASNSKSTVQKEKGSQDGSLTPDSLSNGGGNANFFSTSEHALESESAYGHSEDELARSPQGSSTGRTALESPSQAFSDVFAKSTDADAETHSFDESTWGAFDTHDETDSVWGFNPASTKQESDSDKHRDIFGTDDFGVKPIRTGSPPLDSFFHKKSPFFEDSVAGSPVSRFGNSPRYSEAGDHADNFSRFESFNMHEGGFSPRERLARFDSINSSKDFGHSRAFSSFDDADPFGSSGVFKVSSVNQTPKKGSENWSGF